MRLLYLLFIFAVFLPCGIRSAHDDNEFAEFEDDFTETVTEAPPRPADSAETPKMKTAKVVKDEDFDDDFGVVDEEADEVKEKEADEPVPVEPLKFADVPAHFRSNWASYQVEAIVLVIMLIYMINYAYGRSVNSSMANRVFDYCKPILVEQFALVGDDGVTDLDQITPQLKKDTDFNFSAWCTGRVNVNYLHFQMKMLKRQDIVSRVLNLINPSSDRLTLKISLEGADADPVIIAVGEKKQTTKHVKEMFDLVSFANERKQTAQHINLPPNYVLYSDQSEVVYSILEPGVVSLLKKHEKSIELIHISDQYTGPKPPEGETYTRLPEGQRMMTVVINLDYFEDQDTIEEILNLVFYLVEKIRKLKLSKEAKFKAEKRRKDFEEEFMRNTHQFRQEAAQARREEKTRERKQRLMEETDPDRQKRLEAKELKREAKAKQPKMKQLKVK
ncbi:unnamed protein product [Caenorhabditis bovis]|uniref:PAT complex subunit CCDC47 n=1 Tax=Caenorhabditis bovis TaxID=2654633 RepID=A0A8S1ENZ0_9PELO|nr:unnamed protein product [Caenorhabditis bovis]